MEASSSIFSPESWTLVPRRKWLQDSALKHQTLRSQSLYPVCLVLHKGVAALGTAPGAASRASTDAVNTPPAPCLWCWQQNPTTTPTQLHTWLGPLTWLLFPSMFLCFSEAMWMHHRVSSQINWKSKGNLWVQLQEELLLPMQSSLCKGQTTPAKSRSQE